MAVRLPLQIGTSSIWSLARGAATLLPSLAILGGTVVFLTQVELSKLSLAAAAAGFVFGGLLTWFAAMHLRLAVRGRPSDVVLGPGGFRIEGGRLGGRSIAWRDVNPAAIAVFDAIEKRYTFFRILGNGFAVMAMVFAREKIFWFEAHEFPIRKLYVGLRDGSNVLIGEAERPIEQESLTALYEALVSPGWYGSSGGAPAPPPGHAAGKKRSRHTEMGISVLVCNHCGGVAPPDDKETISCRYCARPIHVPPATRERVAAAQKLARSRNVSDKLVAKLIHQPGAGRTAVLVFAASLPMMLAWPISFAAIGMEARAGVLGVTGALSLAVFPLALILGLFFLLRAQLADRFALRLLTLDFGAHSPRNAGDPYTCRVCDAPLAEQPGRVVIACVYCNADNILGIDLRRDAERASHEATSLESALEKRGKERALWGALTVVAVGLLGLGGFFLVEGLSPMTARPQPKAKPAKATATAAPSANPAPPATQQRQRRRQRSL
jgi:hypothetical protein